MDSLLVFGATGSVGGFLLPRLTNEHWTQVYAVSRREHSSAGDIQWIRADLNHLHADLPAAHSVISLGPLDAFASWLARNPKNAPHRVIALSSMSAQSKSRSNDAEERGLAQRLRMAEENLRRTCTTRNIACTLFRPTLIYGSGTDHSLAPIARFAQHWRLMPIPIGARGLRQPVHVDDLAGACLTILENPATYGQTYAMGGGEPLRFDVMCHRIRAAIPGFVATLPVPFIALHMAAKYQWLGNVKRTMVDRLRHDMIADNTVANQDFGYKPRKFVAEDTIPRPETPAA